MAPARRALVLALLIAGLLQPTANGSSSASTAYQAARSFLRSLSTDATQQRHGHSMQHGHAHAHGSQGLAINLSTSVNVFLEALKDCPAGCEQWGNCNRETGTCECPWGRTGSACEVDQLSHCYVSANKTTPSCGLYVPKNCECYQQCFNMYCVPPSGSTAHYVEYCTHELAQKIGEGRCFLYKDRPQDQQDSAIYNSSDPAVPQLEWFDMPHEPPSTWVGRRPPLQVEKRMEYACWNGYSNWDFVTYAVPLDQCAGRCSERGQCVRNPERVHCICRKGFKGAACELDDDEGACWFAPNCNGHGKCKSGFCHCDKGWWGTGCTRSKAYALAPHSRAVPSRTQLRIYMYDLPADVAYAGEFDDGATTRDAMYTAYEYFFKYFLTDWAVRTENPEEANLFYIPALAFFYVGNVRYPAPHMHSVVRYISSRYPYWNRTGGKDHFWWLTQDGGACALYEKPGNDALTDRPIKVVHFGLSGKGTAWRYSVDPEYGCLRPERDVVVPPVADYAIVKEGRTRERFRNATLRKGYDGDRKWLFFFAGGVNMQDKLVSGNARQTLLTFLKDKNYPDVLVKEGQIHNYQEMFLTSKFCIAPYGYGWGLRLAISVAHGCIPVIIQDRVWQPFEELLPYHEFSVRLAVKDIPKIMEILRAYSDEDIYAMRMSLAKHWQAFMWPQDAGGLAYNYTLTALRRRMHNHASEYYRRGLA